MTQRGIFRTKPPPDPPPPKRECEHFFSDMLSSRGYLAFDPHRRRQCVHCLEDEPDGAYWKRRFEMLEREIEEQAAAAHLAEVREKGT